ncbi:putative tricarboxylic transport membrane protein [Aliiruegeria haliotis]|uniref:Putative tricarboxylic transport membrane protein n=1 Tax=Aliiruegeria haliotis TaxID=1280846 RepID=A0A2T0RFJ1_9RHOB|nr:tripartite tricarboxylate transporter permease [Aliiruegeria haliotis]PRY19938.1 putative tricarboxylic transport membrane protein [Aliiruegeria haliotis]
MELLTTGASLFLSPLTVFLTAAGCFLGLMIGVLPGLGPLMGIILLLPVAFHLEPVAGMGLLIAVYVGGSCGGAISAILLRIPGTPLAAATLLDGYPMARNGRAQDAIGIAISASAIGGLIGGAVLIFFSPFLAEFALSFAPPEYFAMTLLGLMAIVVVARESAVKGFITGAFGLLLATIGTDDFTNAYRFTFGTHNLYNGFHIVAIVVGLFGISEVIYQIRGGSFLTKPDIPPVRAPFRALGIVSRHVPNLVRSSLLGSTFGALPGAGGVISAFTAYAIAKARPKRGEVYGEGAEGGVVATESANNACCGGALIPTLSLGIPGDGSTAVLMAALFLLGFFPGPELFEYNADVAGGIFLAYMSSNLFLLVLGVVLTPVFVSVLRLRKAFLIPAVMLLSTVGVFAIQSAVFDLWVMFGFGIVGYFLRRADYPLAPIVMGAILGPICEANFRRSLLISDDGMWIFLQRPISATILAVVALLAAVIVFRAVRRSVDPERAPVV